jgi:hypothetical protein
MTRAGEPDGVYLGGLIPVLPIPVPDGTGTESLPDFVRRDTIDI